jgi:DNA-binding SARP family transcriptional activator
VAILALSGGKVVSSSLLIGALWQEPQSQQRLRNLHFHVCKLRAVLRGLEPERPSPRIITSPTGYRLMLTGVELDSDDFNRLLQSAQAQARGGDLDHAARSYQDALALWQGPALADTAAHSPWLAAEAAGLDELHTMAFEEATDIALAAGRHHLRSAPAR